MGKAEYGNIQKACDVLQKQPSGSWPVGTVAFSSGFVPLARPGTAIKPSVVGCGDQRKCF